MPPMQPFLHYCALTWSMSVALSQSLTSVVLHQVHTGVAVPQATADIPF